MMQFLGDPGTTQYDLRFSVLGIPVRVHPMFWLIGALLGSSSGPQLSVVAIWIGCLFVSILVHELGHALAARSFGWPPDIVLHGFGGFARYSPGRGYTRRRAIWITFAGPLAGFGLWAIVFTVDLLIDRGGTQGQPWALTLMTSSAWPDIHFAMNVLIDINLFWGLFNLLPVFPLDGGQICSELLNARQNHSGRIRAHQIGMITAALAAAWFLNTGSILGGLMFGSLAYQNYQIVNQLKRGFR
jgi:stage IV sporulation protein FB